MIRPLRGLLLVMWIPLGCQSGAPEPQAANAQNAPERGQRSGLGRLVPHRMALPPELQSDVEILSGARLRTPSRPLEFAPYKVTEYGGDSSEGESSFEPLPPGVEYRAPMTSRNYSFVLTENGRGVFHSDCRERTRGIKCDLTRMSDDSKWKLNLKETEGWLRSDRDEYEIRASPTIEVKNILPMAGFIFSNASGAVAAAETPGRGRLVLRKALSAEERQLLATAAAALLLKRIP